uniref:glutathione transferase n=1 Tax=Romanomermis culicivorax TaxID=13658 RepID=A0A915KR41_ROMCU
MVHYKFTYFYFRGLGESIRYIFHYAGVDFEDDRIQMEDWMKHKSSMPMGQVPVLYVDGKELCQSMAIARYLAKEFGLVPSDNFLAAKADMIVDGLRDQYPLLAKMFPALRNDKDEEAHEVWAEYKEKHMQSFLDMYEKFLTDNGGQFFVGEKISWADIFVAERLD